MREKSKKKKYIKGIKGITRYSKAAGLLLIGLILGIVIGASTDNVIIGQLGFDVITSKLFQSESEHPAAIIDVCFTPPAGCENLIVKQIAQAQKSIYVQAYGFTAPAIIEGLIEAKERGITVRVILDKSNLSSRYSKITQLQKNGIEVVIDSRPVIAHNKIMILDEQKVFTGSYNFTKNANTGNAENLILINDTNIAKT